jgi:hypothetical protein
MENVNLILTFIIQDIFNSLKRAQFEKGFKKKTLSQKLHTYTLPKMCFSSVIDRWVIS